MISGSVLRGAGAFYLGDRATGACPLQRQRGSGGRGRTAAVSGTGGVTPK